MIEHQLVEAAALVVLAAVGAIAIGASLVQRRQARFDGSSRAISEPLGAHSVERAGWAILAAASMGAGVIHLALAPPHFSESGVLGLGFLIAGVAQAGWALAVIRRPTRLFARLAVGGNVAVLLVWALSRTTGLPIGPEAWTPEPVAAADTVAGLFELVVIAGSLISLTGLGARRSAARVRPALETLASIGLVPVVGVVMVMTTLAVSSPGPGHEMSMVVLMTMAFRPGRVDQAARAERGSSSGPV